MARLNVLPSYDETIGHFNKRDPIMAYAIKVIGECKLKRNRNYFVVLCRSIVSQQISTKAADTIFERFRGLFERKLPKPQLVQNLSLDSMRKVGLSRQKTSYLKDLGDKFYNKTIQPNRFSYLSNEEVIQCLTQVRGIGRWTAEMFLIFSLNRLDVLPVDDLGLKVAVKNLYNLKKNPDAKTLKKIAEPWRPFETLGTWYAWRSLNAKIVNY